MLGAMLREEKHPEGPRAANGSTNGHDGGEHLGLDAAGLSALRDEIAAWRAGPVAQAESKVPPRERRFTTWSDLEVPDLVTPADVSPCDYLGDLGLPGEYPFTRGVQPTMYRGKLWTMRMFAGFGTPEQTNARFKYLLAAGADRALHRLRFPHPHGLRLRLARARSARSGMCGVAVDTLRDMEVLFDGIPLDEVTTSMTINGPAIVLLAFYVALADKRGIPRDAIGGTVQNDCLKEFIAQHAWLVPPRPAMRIVTDMIEFCAKRGAALEHGLASAATTSARPERRRRRSSPSRSPTGIALRRELPSQRGLDVDDFAPRLSLLLRRAQRLLRGDRQVPRRAAASGPAS